MLQKLGYASVCSYVITSQACFYTYHVRLLNKLMLLTEPLEQTFALDFLYLQGWLNIVTT